jgi:hypothetical protein
VQSPAGTRLARPAPQSIDLNALLEDEVDDAEDDQQADDEDDEGRPTEKSDHGLKPPCARVAIGIPGGAQSAA